jgi:Lrp/AsnC family transcriptional regulator for asnA, asnC and gidA
MANSTKSPARSGKPPALTDVDLSIIRYLSNDPRCSVSQMAQDLTLPESTVRHRLNRIMEAGLIEFTAIVDPLQFGFNTWIILEIQAKLSHLQSIGEKLAALPQVYFVGLTTGGYDILVGAVFRSTDELAEFVTGPLARIPGIIRTSTSNVMKALKRTSAFGLLGAPAPIEALAPARKPRPRKPRARKGMSG